MVEKKKFCDWCPYNDNSCEGVEGSCDFRTLPMEKEKIIERLRDEMGRVHQMKAELLDRNPDPERAKEMLRDIADVVKGTNIMFMVLQMKFHMSQVEIRKAVGVEQMSVFERGKLLVKLAKLKEKRRGK